MLETEKKFGPANDRFDRYWPLNVAIFGFSVFRPKLVQGVVFRDWHTKASLSNFLRRIFHYLCMNRLGRTVWPLRAAEGAIFDVFSKNLGFCHLRGWRSRFSDIDLFFTFVELFKADISLLMHHSPPADRLAVFCRQNRDFRRFCCSRGFNGHFGGKGVLQSKRLWNTFLLQI